MGKSVGSIFNPDAMNVAGTGQTVGELKKIGYSDSDIGTMGGAKPNTAQRVARGATGAMAGAFKGIGQQPQQGGLAQQGAPAPIQVTPTPDVSGFYPQQPLMDPLNKRPVDDPFRSMMFGR